MSMLKHSHDISPTSGPICFKILTSFDEERKAFVFSTFILQNQKKINSKNENTTFFYLICSFFVMFIHDKLKNTQVISPF